MTRWNDERLFRSKRGLHRSIVSSCETFFFAPWRLGVNLFLAAVFACTATAAPITFADLLARPRANPTKTIAYGPAPHQFAELWLPKDKGPHPTVIMIHGGCWLASLPGTELMAYISEDLRKAGYAVWSIDYRRIGEDGGGYPGTFLDTAAAIDKLRDVAPTHNLNLKKLVVIGHSAGGHLGMWAAARRRLPKSSPLAQADPLPIVAVVSLAGINDLAAYRAEGPSACGGSETIDSLVGASTRRGDPYADTSPAALLPIGAKLVVISGGLDKIVPESFGMRFVHAASKAGDQDVSGAVFTKAGHFELIDPTSEAWTNIRGRISTLMQ
jgi:acetyl esterase/lipase